MSIEILIHIANILLFISFSVRSMLALRGLNIVAGCFFIAYFLSLDTPLWSSVGWNILFGLVNLRNIYLIILERRPPVLTTEEQRLYHEFFSSLTPRAFRNLLDLGQWENGLPPTLLIATGQRPERVWLVVQGYLDVQCGQGRLRRIKVGDFVGETAFLAKKPMIADVSVAEPVRFISWPTAELQAFIDNSPESGAAIQRILSECLVRKLNRVDAAA